MIVVFPEFIYGQQRSTYVFVDGFTFNNKILLVLNHTNWFNTKSTKSLRSLKN